METRSGWEKVVCWSTKVAISLKRVKIEEKLLWRAYRKSPTLFQFFGSPPYFYFRFCLYGHRDGRFCLIFLMVQMDFLAVNHVLIVGLCKSVKNSKVHRVDIFAIAQLSCFI